MFEVKTVKETWDSMLYEFPDNTFHRADICCKFWSIPVIGGFSNESIGHNQADSEGLWNESE